MLKKSSVDVVGRRRCCHLLQFFCLEALTLLLLFLLYGYNCKEGMRIGGILSLRRMRRYATFPRWFAPFLLLQQVALLPLLSYLRFRRWCFLKTRGSGTKLHQRMCFRPHQKPSVVVRTVFSLSPPPFPFLFLSSQPSRIEASRK